MKFILPTFCGHVGPIVFHFCVLPPCALAFFVSVMASCHDFPIVVRREANDSTGGGGRPSTRGSRNDVSLREPLQHAFAAAAKALACLPPSRRRSRGSHMVVVAVQ